MQGQIKIGLDVSGLDPSFKEHATRGIGRYVREISAGLAEKFSNGNSDDPVHYGTFNHLSLAPSPFLDSLLKSCPVGKQTLRQQIYYPYRLFRIKEFNVLHFPAQMDPPAFCPVPYIVSVMDLIPLVLSDLYSAGRSTWRFKLARFLELKAIRRASLILSISQTTADDLVNILGISKKRIIVTPLGVDEKFFHAQLKISEEELRHKYNLPKDRPVMLYVGGIDQRKNCEGMLKTLQQVKAECLKEQMPLPILVMAGKIQQDKQYPKLVELISEFDLHNDVFMLGYVPDEDLLQIFKISTLFLFLSLYEGFGLPPLEAMASGLPVVSSNTSAMPEVLGDSALLVDPSNADQSTKAVLDILKNKELAQKLSEAGEKQARHFSWQRTVDLTAEAYRNFEKVVNKRD